MNAMTILRRCRQAKNDLERLEQRIDQRREVLDGLSAPVADPNGGSRGGGDPDKTGRIVADIDALEREMEARKAQEQAEKVAAISLLDMVPDLEGRVLHDYYIRRWDTTMIARKRKYTPGYVRKTKRSGERLMEMLSPERVMSVLPAWYIKERGEDDE